MSDLKDLLQGAGEAKRQLFASEDFAGGYGRAVVSRVKRRRAVSATAMGGGTVVAVGALSVAAFNTPWSSFVLGATPVGSASVVCTTIAATAPTPSEDVALSVGHVPSPSGSVIWAVVVGAQEPPNVVAYIALDLDTHEVTGSGQEGDSVVLTPDADGVYAIQFTDGNRITFEVTDEKLVLKTTSLEPTGEPTVTCMTTTPEAPDNVSITTAPFATDSPFECGYVFSTSGHTSGDLSVGYTAWLTAPDAEAEIRSQYEDPHAANLQTSGKLVPRAEIELAGKWRGADVPGTLVLGDPADLGDVTTADEFRDAFGTYQFGVRYVLATHGVVVATAVLPVENQTQYMTWGGPGAVLYGLDLTPAGMEACDGVDEATLAAADVVAVAGITYIDGDEISRPHYAWNEVARNY